MIRIGQKEDLSAVLELIRELAAFEKAPDEVEVTVKEMYAWAFGKEKTFDFFVLEVEQKIVGIAVYYYKYSTWKGRCLFLEDIIVTESERGKGYGKKLFAGWQKSRKKKRSGGWSGRCSSGTKMPLSFIKSTIQSSTVNG